MVHISWYPYNFSFFWEFLHIYSPKNSVGNPKTNSSPIFIWGYLFEVCSDHLLIFTLIIGKKTRGSIMLEMVRYSVSTKVATNADTKWWRMYGKKYQPQKILWQRRYGSFHIYPIWYASDVIKYRGNVQ